VIIEDNNGYFAPGSGTGIAPGAIRFANIPFWQTIPQGTFIVIAVLVFKYIFTVDESAHVVLPPENNGCLINSRIFSLESLTAIHDATTTPRPHHLPASPAQRHILRGVPVPV
jgi:hypothetical protein